MDIEAAASFCVGLASAGLGLFVAAAVIARLRKVFRMMPTAGRVEEQAVIARAGSASTQSGEPSASRLTVRFQVQGRTYTTHRLSLFSDYAGWSHGNAGRRLLAGHPEGSELVVYVDPKDPADAVLDRRIPFWRQLQWLAGTTIPLACGLYGMWSAF
jgi:hypothetical protein